MVLAKSLRFLPPLLAGLALGVAGAVLFSGSLPGSEGSAEERANRLEVELKQAKNRLAALEGSDRQDRGSGTLLSRVAGRRTRQTLADGTRQIAEDLREGRPVSPEDLFRASKPLIRDLAPLFDRMRIKQQQQMIDSLTGEFSRKYKLTPENQQKLREWFLQKSDTDGKKWNDLIARDGTRLEDIMRASRDVRPDDGLDPFMQNLLSAEQRTAFNNDRAAERAGRVQQQADAYVQRIDSIVTLDENQRDQVFGVTARSSRDYDASLLIQGAHGPLDSTPVTDREAATLAVLRPDQRATYEAERQRRRDETAKSMSEIGLTMPQDWQMLNDSDFR